MGDFKKNPKEPFRVSIPESTKRKMKGSIRYKRENKKLKKAAKVKQLPLVAPVPERGLMWSRFINRIKNFFGRN